MIVQSRTLYIYKQIKQKMNKTKDNKPHIGIYGRRNCGKSMLTNLLAGQDVSIVSNHAGSTTDPVKKTVEILNMGPVILIDTAGVDDFGELGEKRISKTVESIKTVDLALLVVSNNDFSSFESDLIFTFNKYDIPFIIVHNKADEIRAGQSIKKFAADNKAPFVEVSSISKLGFNELVELIKNTTPQNAFQQPSLLKDIIKQDDVILLITPIDSEAPAGRMILPQVQTIRDVLDNEAVAITLKENAVSHFLKSTNITPALVITDSQIFKQANRIIPSNIPLTSFSIVLSRIKGPFEELCNGTSHISTLKNGDKILILESCSHHTSCEDIGRTKLPRWLSEFTSKSLDFDVIAGLNAIKCPITDYALIIQCGGCMITKKQFSNRLHPAIEAGIPVSNYGMAIAYINGIFERAIAPFKK